MDIYLITKNKGKLLAAQNAFENKGIRLLFIEKDYEEIQADTSLEIARFTATQAARELGVPAIREDHGLFITALGIPGPYMNYFEKKMPVKILLELLKNLDDRTGYFEVATVYAKPDGTTKEFTFRVPFVFSLQERGELQDGWNKIIMLQGETRTLAEYPETERLHIWNQNYAAIAAYLKN